MQGDKDEKLIKTNKPDQFIVLSVAYDIGGANYFSGGVNERGYYLHCAIETRKDGTRSFMMFGGIKKLLLPVKRQSPKSLAQAQALAPEWEQKLIDHVLAKNPGVQVVPEGPAFIHEEIKPAAPAQEVA